MSRALRPRRSLALRISMAAAVAILLASTLGFGLAYLGTVHLLQAQLDEAIADEAETLAGEWRLFGPAGLRAAVEARSIHKGPDAFGLRLDQPGREPLYAGRPFAAPRTLAGSTDLPQPDASGPTLRGLGLLFPDGSTLVVAADPTRLHRTARAIGGQLFGAGVLTAVLAVLAGMVLARRAERRLAQLSIAAQSVMAGDLSRRLPLDGSGDELDRLTATVNEMLGRIEALMAALRQVSDDIAHDLRSPLGRLRQRLEGALAAPRDPEADSAALQAALEELDAVLATFAALLRIAQVEAGARGAFAPLDLSALVAGVAEAYAPVAEEAGATLETAIAPGIGLAGDAGLLRQMLANLIENALAHGGAGVRIAVSLAPGPVLEVRDDGPGIPPEEREKVLRRFYRLDRSRGTPGTGLGLALVAAVARLHGGAVTLADAAPGTPRPGLAVRVRLG